MPEQKKAKKRTAGEKLLRADAKKAGDHPDDYVNEFLDAALTDAEERLRGMLKYFSPGEIAEQFAVHVRIHLHDEMANIKAHGHHSDDPDDEPIKQQITPLAFVQLVARMKTLSEFGDDQPGNDDYVDTLDNLIATARQISPETRTAAQDDADDEHPQTDSHLATCPSCMMAHDKALPDAQQPDEEVQS